MTDTSARFRTTNRQFSYSKITVQLELVIVQKDSTQSVDSSARVKITLLKVLLELVTVKDSSAQVITLLTVQLEPVTVLD